MAEKPLQTPLSADLPENWEMGQTIAPAGETVGLTKQHGYNYQAKQINDAQKAINKINDAFAGITASILRVSMTLTAEAWMGAAGGWLQTLELPGLLDSDVPDVYPASMLTLEELQAYHMLADYADASDGVLTLRCREQVKPGVDIPIQVVVMR